MAVADGQPSWFDFPHAASDSPNFQLADEYDAAQERGEVATKGKPVKVPGDNIKATAEELGIDRKDIHEARKIRDAEIADPGIVRRTVDAALAAGQEPSKAVVKRAVVKAVKDANAPPAASTSSGRRKRKRWGWRLVARASANHSGCRKTRVTSPLSPSRVSTRTSPIRRARWAP